MNIDTEGLHAIAVPPDGSEVSADIVFVHGLGGGSHSTWQSAQADRFFWPAELAKDLPSCAIWSLGYAAGMSHWMKADGMAIQDRAKNLVLKLLNKEIGKRPLIFITHSMGGLEVKEIIVRSQTCGSSEWQEIVSNIRGIVFCGTPHRGSHIVTAASVLGKVLRLQTHVRQMASGSTLLDSLHDEFITWQAKTKTRVESYVEKVGISRGWILSLFTKSVLVVPTESGNPGIPGCDCHPITADHINLVKPDHKESDVYAGVLRFVRKLLPAAGGSISIPTLREQRYLTYTLATDSVDEKTSKCSGNGLQVSGVDQTSPSAEIIRYSSMRNALFISFQPHSAPFYYEREIDQTINAALLQGGIWLWGKSGVGKTVALQRVASHLNLKCVFIDLSSAYNTSPGALLEDAYWQIVDVLNIRAKMHSASHGPEYWVRSIASVIASNLTQDTLLIIDEFSLRSEDDLTTFVNHVISLVFKLTNQTLTNRLHLAFASNQMPAAPGTDTFFKVNERIPTVEMKLWDKIEINGLASLILNHVNLPLNVADFELLDIKTPRMLKTLIRLHARELENNPSARLEETVRTHADEL